MKKINLIELIHRIPSIWDALFLCIFGCLITYQPYIFQSEINFPEYNYYLPGINAVLSGAVPYRDFFHLRGPLDIYIPALLMKFFGVKVSVLALYFYIGNVLAILLCILIAKEVLRTKYLYYLFSLVLIARTFPRVVYSSWGGLRYAFGLLVVLCLSYFFKKQKKIWMVLAGVFSVLGGLMSIEIGVCAVFSILIALGYVKLITNDKYIEGSFRSYLSGFLLALVPFIFYFLITGALIPFFESVIVVVTQMEKVINLRIFSSLPRNIFEIIPLMFMPAAKNFRHVTPIYMYLFLAGYVLFQWREMKSKIDISPSVVCLGAYGFVMYCAAFRNIWAAQFEMALQPEKILLFFLIERVYCFLRTEKNMIGSRLKVPQMFKKNIVVERIKFYGIVFLLVGLFMSSVNYSLMRYNRRFVAFKMFASLVRGDDVNKIHPYYGEEVQWIDFDRAGKWQVPVQQAKELEEMQEFVSTRVGKDETIFVYPDKGSYYFLFSKPFVGKFPVAIFSWFKKDWHDGFVSAVKKQQPTFVILPKEVDIAAFNDYFTNYNNKLKYHEMMSFIKSEYVEIKATEKSEIYVKRIKDE